MKTAHICCGGPTQIIVDKSRNEWFFEMHSYCGPFVLNKNGDPAKNQPGPKSIFWHIVSQWAQQGEKVANGYCVYDNKIPLKPADQQKADRV